MTIVSLDRLSRGGRFVASYGVGSRLGEFARICRRRRSCDSFPNRPYGQRILLCPKGNEGMSEGRIGKPSIPCACIFVEGIGGMGKAIEITHLDRSAADLRGLASR